MENKHGLSEVMDTMISKVHEMVDHNTIVGEPIATPDGITLIPVSRVSIGLGSGGTEYGTGNHFAGGGGAGVRVDPVSFIIVKDAVAKLEEVYA